MYNQNALRNYQSVDLQSKVSAASPHGLVTLLLEGGQKNLHLAKCHMAQHNIAQKGECIGKAIRIVDSLRSSLDFEKGGEIADNLSGLYSYMERRLLKANADSDPAIIDEVSGLLSQIKSAWDAIPGEYRGS